MFYSNPKAVDEHKAKFDREMLLKGKNLSEAEFEELMKKHREQLAKLEQNMRTQKEARTKSIQQKVRDFKDQYLLKIKRKRNKDSNRIFGLLLFKMDVCSGPPLHRGNDKINSPS